MMTAIDAIDEIDLFCNPEKYLNLIQDENPMTRRNGAKEILVQMQSHLAKKEKSNEVYIPDDIVTPFLRPVIKLIQDQLEKTREYAYELLGIYIHKLPHQKVKDFLPTLIPIMVGRLGQPEINEPSEEIRVLAIRRIEDLLNVLKNVMNPFIDDIIQILANGITDPFHEARILSCQVASLAADACRTVFHYNSDRLLRPLAMTIAHQHSRVRVQAVKCIQQVVLLGNHKGIQQILPYAIQRIFDPIPGVRLAVVEAFGLWMVDYIDRYSYFPKLIPVLMSFQDDDDPRVQAKARSMWDAAGQKYMEENLEKFRDEIDFDSTQPQHYPIGVTRPSVGCRLLMWQNVSAFLPALPNELTDWMPGTRIKAAQLVYFMILNSEEKITMHIDKILPILSRSISDADPIVSTYCSKAAMLIGVFIPFEAIWPILMLTWSTGASEGFLTILYQILNGLPQDALKNYAPKLIKFFVDSEMLDSHNAKRQQALLGCVRLLIAQVPEITLEEDDAVDLYEILLSVWAQFQNHDTELAANAIDGLTEFANCRGQDLNELMGDYAGGILEKMKNTTEWTTVSLDRLIFHVILVHGGLAVDRNMDVILKIMSTNLDPQKDPEVRLRFFQALTGHLMAYCKSAQVQKDLIQNFVAHIIQDVLNPNLRWAPGKSSSVLRTAAMSCLLAIVNSTILDPETLVNLSPKIVTTVIGSSEDAVEFTRFFSCAVLQAMAEHAGPGVSVQCINNMFEMLIKRLDDVAKRVRCQALDSIHAVFNYIAVHGSLSAHDRFASYVFNRLILHMDDRDDDIQEQIQTVLQGIGMMYPQYLVEECETAKTKHRNPKRCEQLIQMVNDFQTSNAMQQMHDLTMNSEHQSTPQ